MRAAGAGRIARWVLPACTLLGLATMHSLGHGGAHVAAMSAHHAAPPVAMAVTAPGEDCPDGHCRQVSGPGHGRHDDMPAWNMCLAVLAGLAITALLAWMLRAAGTGSRTALPPGPVRPGASRGPPRPRVGLRLARVSVLRT